MNKKIDKPEPHALIELWQERDLTAAATRGELEQAFEVDDVVGDLAELLAAGRFPVLAGESGVGKTAIVHELIRRAAAGDGPDVLLGKRIVQFSLERVRTSIEKASEAREVVARITDALIALRAEIVPFFSDVHYALAMEVVRYLLALSHRGCPAVLAEGPGASVRSLFERHPEVAQRYMLVPVEEPSLEKTRRIIEAWSQVQIGRTFAADALEEGLYLSHRFLTRGHQPRKSIDLLRQVAGVVPAGQVVQPADLVTRFCKIQRTPRSLVDATWPLDLAALERQFNARVLGQPEAVRAVVTMIGQIKAGLSDYRRPFGVFLFVGPTGVGKTHIAQLLAEHLFGNRERLVRLNMADYAEAGTGAQVLFGCPWADRLELMRGVLTERVAGLSLAVLLLDEFEKAHAEVHDRFLQLVDEGCFINAMGETVSCRAMIIIATTNAGAEVYRGHTLGFTGRSSAEDRDEELHRLLEQRFRFEFLNRFDQIVHFRPLNREAIRAIARREIEALQERPGVRQRGLRIEIDDAVIDWLAVYGYDPDFGARFLRRIMERHVTSALADAIVRGRPPAGATVMLTVRGNRVVARLPGPAASPAPSREAVTLPRGTQQQVCILDRDRLLAETEALLAAAEPLRATLQGKRAERSALLERMNDAGFWERREERAAVLDRFRALDVAVRAEERLAARIERLAELFGPDRAAEAELPVLGRGLETAADAFREWNDLLASEGSASLWLVVSNVDALDPAEQWVASLVEMELAWCRRARLAARIVGYALADEQLARVGLLVEGPRAGGYLAMEEGIHRYHRRNRGDWRARIEIIPRGGPAAEDQPSCPVEHLRSRTGRFDLSLNCQGSIALRERGIRMSFVGGVAEILSQFLSDCEWHWNRSTIDQVDVARIYGAGGRGAVDQRTGAAVPRLKDVLRGDLDVFLEAWRRQTRGADVSGGAPLPDHLLHITGTEA